MARLPKDKDELEDENITLTPNEGVDEENLKDPKLSEDQEEEEKPEEIEEKPLKTAEPEPEQLDEAPVEEEEARPEAPRMATEPADPEEDVRPRYSQSMNMEEGYDYPTPKGEHTLDDLTEEEPEPVSTGYRPVNNPYAGSNIPHINSQYPSSGVYSNREPGNSKGKGKLVLLGIIVVLVLLGAVYMLKGKSLFRENSPAPSEAPIAESSSTPTPEPTPSFDRSQFKIRILNGTLKTGLAASEAAKLKDLGYQIDKTSNATNSAFPQTIVRVKASATGLGDNLVKDLAPDYTATGSGTLPASDTADGEVTLGAK